ncbi:glycosyltransferase [Mucilaginibacter daejeonensis]|uniref:glycosyltransferase family 2 protein n=1 Tax=Mucilaginibacter daejeonensis TaxID=398049 RepID=UPI001D172C04|nr:glycosyltransferase family 2 protein [Mucilaginibacter daejeonensis]UEG52970.1 glycosyltransferase [Mucilaginibacter daejeonensis]
MLPKPSYTIGIPVYKRIFGFEEALRSALDVDGCTEVVVCDDGSGHDEFKIICESVNDPRVKYHLNDVNLGLFGNWNNCIQIAQGEFVSILCSDDLIAPSAYESFYEAYNNHPDIDVFFGHFTTFTDSLEATRTSRTYKPGYMTGEELIIDGAINGVTFPVLTISKRSTLLRFPFVDKPHSGNDWLWIYGNARNFKLFAADKTINYWRRHDDQDAAKSQSITTDCWPMMYMLMAKQLKQYNNSLYKKAALRAEGVVLGWLLNDRASNSNYWVTRFNSAEAHDNIFLKEAVGIINNNWLLRGLLKKSDSFFFDKIGRIARKFGFYPSK